jgi:hypothetical protein
VPLLPPPPPPPPPPPAALRVRSRSPRSTQNSLKSTRTDDSSTGASEPAADSQPVPASALAKRTFDSNPPPGASV